MLKYYLAIIAVITLFSCRQNSNSATSMAETTAKFGDFEDFYKRFHWDSTFQMSRINFPLEGLPQDADSITIADNDFLWQKEDWVMHRGFEKLKADFTQDFVPFGDDIITERIIHTSGSVGMIRRFARLDGKWYLIYYAGLNRLAPKTPEISIEGGFDG